LFADDDEETMLASYVPVYVMLPVSSRHQSGRPKSLHRAQPVILNLLD